jgi:Phage stabilisation protein
MPALQPIPFVGGSYADESRPYSFQECVNYLPEMAESGDEKSSGILRGVPGLKTVATLSGTGGGGYRGAHNANGALFVVQGTQLFSISGALAGTALGTIDGTGRVSMSHNQIAGGNEVTIVNGPQGWVWNTVTSTLTQITDPGFTGSSVTGYINSYTVQLDPLGQNWYVSNLADSTTYDPSNVFQAEADPDIIKTLVTDHQEVWAFGANTVQQFLPTGDLDILFQSQQGTVMEIGIGGSNTAVAIDNSIYWLGSDGIVYFAAGGYLPVRVSTFAVEQDIQTCNWDNAYAFGWTDRGHKVYYITFPDGRTWGFDISQKLWHRRESYGLNHWRVNHIVYWNNDWYGTDFNNGNLYRLDWETFTEGSDPLVSRRICPPSRNNQSRVLMSGLQFYMDLGNGPLLPDSYVSVRYSDNGGFTWSNWKEYSINDARNNFSRVVFRKLGSFRNRMIEVMVSANCRRNIIAAYASLKESSS